MNKKRQSSCRIPSQNCIKGGGGLWGGIRKGPRLWQQDTTQTWKNDQEKRKEIRNEEITATNSNWNFPEAFSNRVIGWRSTPSYRVAGICEFGLSGGKLVSLVKIWSGGHGLSGGELSRGEHQVFDHAESAV